MGAYPAWTSGVNPIQFVAVAWNGSHAESILTGEIWTQKLETEAYDQGLNQYGRTSKMEALQDKVEKEMIAKTQSGAGKYSLQMHTTFYKTSYAKLKGCSFHVDVEARVFSLLGSVECKNVKGNTNMLKDFDKTVNYVLPVCPIMRNKGKEQN